jgi:alpha-galactosidase
MLGCDVRKMIDATRAIVLNREVIAVDQDPLGRQGWRLGANYHAGERQEAWAKPLADGSFAVGMFNLGTRDYRQNVAWEVLGIHDRRACRVRDLWAHEDLGEATGSFSAVVGPHDVCLVRLTPVMG